MILHVVTERSATGDESVDEYAGPEVQFMTEPSGVLLIMERPGKLWAAYAPGSWWGVRRGGEV